MKNRGKTALKFVACSLLLLALTACTNVGKQSEEGEYVRPVYEEEVVFVNQFDAEHIDVLAGDIKKMYAVPKKLKDTVKSFKENDVIIVEYTLDNELKRNVENFRLVGSHEVVKEEKKKEEKIEEIEKTELLEVYRNGTWVEERAKLVDDSESYSLLVLGDFDFSNATISSKKDSLYQVSVEELEDDAEIKPLRWGAADLLKSIGELKELKGDQIYNPNFRDAEFVFTAEGSGITKNVVVKKEEGRLIKYTMTFPIDDEQKYIESSLWAMMESLKFK